MGKAWTSQLPQVVDKTEAAQPPILDRTPDRSRFFTRVDILSVPRSLAACSDRKRVPVRLLLPVLRLHGNAGGCRRTATAKPEDRRRPQRTVSEGRR